MSVSAHKAFGYVVSCLLTDLDLPFNYIWFDQHSCNLFSFCDDFVDLFQVDYFVELLTCSFKFSNV